MPPPLVPYSVFRHWYRIQYSGKFKFKFRFVFMFYNTILTDGINVDIYTLTLFFLYVGLALRQRALRCRVVNGYIQIRKWNLHAGAWCMAHVHGQGQNENENANANGNCKWQMAKCKVKWQIIIWNRILVEDADSGEQAEGSYSHSNHTAGSACLLVH